MMSPRVDATCAQVNPKGGRKIPQRIEDPGSGHGEHKELDFTEIRPTVLGYNYWLVFVDTFSR